MSASEDIAAVLALDEQLRTALNERDFEVIEQLDAAEFTLNSPAGTVQSREDVITLLRSTRSRQTDVERTIETTYAVGDVVVIMGRESLVWDSTGRHDLDGKRTARRFTNVSQRTDRAWRQIARQATTVPLDE